MLIPCVIGRAPDDPKVQITKRLIALENDVVWDDLKQVCEVLQYIIYCPKISFPRLLIMT